MARLYGSPFQRRDGIRWNIYKDLVWKSGVAGLNVIVRDEERINKSTVLRLLSDASGATEWLEVQGPDSMQLR
jgi:hypothetical protein